jgi:hypothetical protein
MPDFIQLSHAVGHFKHVYNGPILNYFALGPKQYSLIYLNKLNQLENVNHFCGLSLGPSRSTNLSSSDIQVLLQKFQANEHCLHSIKNKRRKFDSRYLTLRVTTSQYTLSNNVKIKRIIKFDEHLTTIPYGFLDEE